MELHELEYQLKRLQAYNDISNLMGRYQYLHTGGQMNIIGRELFAYELPDARCEYGPLGVFGPEKSLQFFDAMTELFTKGKGHCTPGRLELHQITTPVIEVADDLKTAKGMWMSTGAFLRLHDDDNDSGHSFAWNSGKYAVDFINLDGVWKIWHLHVCDLWRTDFDHDPVEHAGILNPGTTQEMIDVWNRHAAAGKNVRPHGIPVIPDAPTTFHYSYAVNSVAPQFPPPPQPYDTFENTFAY